MTDFQFKALISLVADKFAACKTMEEVKQAIEDLRELTSEKDISKAWDDIPEVEPLEDELEIIAEYNKNKTKK
ncbi:MAG: hypothetical protein FWF50_03025 [Defluviitaleaceae bacterium]|nr:hypothetical protein [Defluviitaleaceae bacterium]